MFTLEIFLPLLLGDGERMGRGEVQGDEGDVRGAGESGRQS